MEKYRAATEIVHPPKPTEAVKWHPPDHPVYKLNVDGVAFKELIATSMDMVLRDSEGNVLVEMSKRITATLAALEAEEKSIKTAVHFAWEMGFREVIFETDSLILCKVLSGSTEPQRLAPPLRQ